MSNHAAASLFPLRRGPGVLPLTSRPLLPASKVIAPRTLLFIMVLVIGLPIVFFTRLVATPARFSFDYHPRSINLATAPPPARPDAPATLSIPAIMKREEGDVGVAGWNGDAQAVKDALPMPTIFFATPPKCDDTATDTESGGQAKRDGCDQWWTVQESGSAAASEIRGWVGTQAWTEAGTETYESEWESGAMEVDAGTATDSTTATQVWEQEAQATGSVTALESAWDSQYGTTAVSTEDWYGQEETVSATTSYDETAVATASETGLSSYSDESSFIQSFPDSSTLSATPSTASSTSSTLDLTDTAFQTPSLSSSGLSSASLSASPSTRTHTFTGTATRTAMTTAVSASSARLSLSSSQASHVSSGPPPTTLHHTTTALITKPHTSTHSLFIATLSSTDVPLAASTQSPSSDAEEVNMGVAIAAIVLIIVGVGTIIIIFVLHTRSLIKLVRERRARAARQRIRQDAEMGTRETTTQPADPYTPVPPRVRPASAEMGEQGAERAGTPAECLPVQEAKEGEEQDPRVTAMKLLEGR
ncbi:hypothetical protein IAT38_001617 [Cryptococcus sp. DSM 104549]